MHLVTLPIAAVQEDPTLQLRDGLDRDRVEAMVEHVNQGGTLPPITVVDDGYLVADGHHRLAVGRLLHWDTVQADVVPGSRAEAVALAITCNDLAGHQPLTRVQRNQGVKLLLQAGWTQERVAEATGVSQHTISNIANALAMRGQIAKPAQAAGTTGGKPPKPVAVLPPEVHEQLNDTTLVRISEMVPVEQQVEFATAVVESGLPEPRVREAAADLRADPERSPADAVWGRAPATTPRPVSPDEVAGRVRRALDDFLARRMTIEGQDYDFWQVLDVLANYRDVAPLEIRGLATALADLSVRADHYASLLRDGQALKAIAR